MTNLRSEEKAGLAGLAIGATFGVTCIPTALRWVTPVTASIGNFILNPAHVTSFASHIARFIAGWGVLLTGELACYFVPPLVLAAAVSYGAYKLVQHKDDIKNTFVDIGHFFGAFFHRPSQAQLAAYRQQQQELAQQQQQQDLAEQPSAAAAASNGR